MCKMCDIIHLNLNFIAVRMFVKKILQNNYINALNFVQLKIHLVYLHIQGVFEVEAFLSTRDSTRCSKEFQPKSP
jgi:hypothetical protein